MQRFQIKHVIFYINKTVARALVSVLRYNKILNYPPSKQVEHPQYA